MLILGTANVGSKYGILDKPLHESVKLLQFAFENGISHLDTSNGYLNSYQVISKTDVSWNLNAKIRISKSNSSFTEAAGKSIEEIKEQIPKAKINAVLFHNILDLQKYGNREISQSIAKLKEIYDINKIGISVYPEQFHLVKISDFDIVQIPFNILDQRFFEYSENLIEEIKLKHVQARSIFLQGLLTRKYLQQEDFKFECKELDLFHKHCLEKDLNPEVIACYFIRKNQFIKDYIFGASNEAEIKMNINNFESAMNLDIDFRYEQYKCSDLKVIDPRYWISN